MGVPPVIIHFKGIFPDINHPAMGVYPMAMETPIWVKNYHRPAVSSHPIPSLEDTEKITQKILTSVEKKERLCSPSMFVVVFLTEEW